MIETPLILEILFDFGLTRPAVAGSYEIPYVPKNKRTNSMTHPVLDGMIETPHVHLKQVFNRPQPVKGWGRLKPHDH